MGVPRPRRLKERLGDPLDPAAIAATTRRRSSPSAARPPAIHRFPGSMAARTHELCRVLAEEYGGDPAAVWHVGATGQELHQRLKALPGFGDQKAKIFLALLAKRMGVHPAGWEEAAAPFADDSRRSVADADTPEPLAKVRAWKKTMKAAAKADHALMQLVVNGDPVELPDGATVATCSTPSGSAAGG